MVWKQVIPGVFEGSPNLLPQLTPELEFLIRLSNIPPFTRQSHRLLNWQHKEDEPWWAEVFQYSEVLYSHPFLTLLGPPGSGKTHLALSIAWSWLERGKTVLYYQVESLMDSLSKGYRIWESGNPDGYQSILAFTLNASLLILDDFGVEQPTEWAATKLDQIIDDRYLNKKPLIITSNLALDRLSPRVADRLREGTLIQLKGESFRKKGRG